jgi:hypothetical protein
MRPRLERERIYIGLKALQIMVFMMGGFGLLWLIGFIAVVWAVIDIVKQNKETGWKLIWLVITILLNIVGVIIYYFISGRKKINWAKI